MKNLADVRDEIATWRALEQHSKDALELAELEDESLRPDLEKETNDLEAEIDRRQISTLLSGPYDKGNAIVAIHSGAGGTEAQDWAAMLNRMYLRWMENHGYKAEVLDMTDGEEAGIKSTTIAVTGRFAFGYLKAEKGVHRLVRLSPFDAAHRRHTSFAQVEVLPEVENDFRNSNLMRRIFALMCSVHRVQAAKMFRRTLPPCALPICRLDWWFLARTNGLRCRTVRTQCGCSKHAC